MLGHHFSQSDAFLQGSVAVGDTLDVGSGGVSVAPGGTLRVADGGFEVATTASTTKFAGAQKLCCGVAKIDVGFWRRQNHPTVPRV